jgi:hypothetical protein
MVLRRAPKENAPLVAMNTPGPLSFVAAALLCMAIGAGILPAGAQEAQAGDQAATSGDAESETTLSERVEDPTARLTKLQLKDQYTPAEYGTDAQPNTLLLRPIMAVRPHGPLNLEQIVRPTFFLKTVPQGSGASTVTAFGDTQLFDLLVIPWPNAEQTGLRWGIGPYFIFPTATNDRVGKGAWQVGGASGFRYNGVRGLLLSALVQQATSFAYTSPRRIPITSLTVQPIVTYQLGSGWYLKSSDATWTFNLRHNTSTEMPVSAGVGKVWKFADGLALNFAVSGEWMVYRQFDRQTEQFTVNFEVTMLLPTLVF